jgi:hypothetical protein
VRVIDRAGGVGRVAVTAGLLVLAACGQASSLGCSDGGCDAIAPSGAECDNDSQCPTGYTCFNQKCYWVANAEDMSGDMPICHAFGVDPPPGCDAYTCFVNFPSGGDDGKPCSMPGLSCYYWCDSLSGWEVTCGQDGLSHAPDAPKPDAGGCR